MPPANQRTIRVEGLRELSRAFALADKAERKLFRESLKDAAEPVRGDAESRATIAIKPGRIPWSSMRVGVTRTSVYVAPARRRSTSLRRPKFAAILMDKAMAPALEAHHGEVENRVDHMLGDVSRIWERA